MTQDLLALLPLAVLVLFTALACETAARRNWLPYWISRKLLHTIAVGACAVAPLLVDNLFHLFYLVLPIWLSLIFLVARGIIMRDEHGRPAWGIVWFPLAYLILLFFAGDNVGLVVFPMAVLAICDPLATIAGTLFARAYYELTGEEKSQTGNAAFFLGFIFLAGWLLPYLGLDYGRSDFKLLVLLFGVMVTAAEALGSYGRDNLYVPLVTGMLVQRMPSEFLFPNQLILVLLLCIPFIWWTVRRGSLTLGGAIAASLLAMLVVAFSNLEMIFPLLVFFASSVIVGKLFPARVQSDEKAGKARDAWQVFCNGGVYVLLLFLFLFCTSAGLSLPASSLEFNYTTSWYEFAAPLWVHLTRYNSLYWLALPMIAVAIATSDTWSSEVGQHFKGPTYDILRWKKIPPGLSGGISIAGTIAGLIGAAVIGKLATSFATFAIPLRDIAAINSSDSNLIFELTNQKQFFLLITIAGFLGMLIDSLLGAALQAKYLAGETVSEKQTASPSSDLKVHDLRDQPQFAGQKPVRGFSWMSNDWVNLLSQVVVVGLLLFLFS